MRKDMKANAQVIAEYERLNLGEKEQIVVKHAKKLKNRGPTRNLGTL